MRGGYTTIPWLIGMSTSPSAPPAQHLHLQELHRRLPPNEELPHLRGLQLHRRLTPSEKVAHLGELCRLLTFRRGAVRPVAFADGRRCL